nr:hypothetical protein [Isoptericola sediminis]
MVVGAGIPALFALALRLLAGTTAPPQERHDASTGPAEVPGPVVIARPPLWRLVGALLCFAVVIGAVASGIVFLAAGGHS